jgi:Tol biopolymer transport system component
VRACLPACGGGSELYLISPDAKQLRRLTHRPNLINDGPTWSPDGKGIAFIFGRPSGGGPEGIRTLAVIDRDGSHRHTILRIRGHMYGSGPNWQRRRHAPDIVG